MRAAGCESSCWVSAKGVRENAGNSWYLQGRRYSVHFTGGNTEGQGTAAEVPQLGNGCGWV